MSMPGTERSAVRDILHRASLGILLVLPTVIGFQISSAATTGPPASDEVAPLLPILGGVPGHEAVR